MFNHKTKRSFMYGSYLGNNLVLTTTRRIKIENHYNCTFTTEIIIQFTKYFDVNLILKYPY